MGDRHTYLESWHWRAEKLGGLVFRMGRGLHRFIMLIVEVLEALIRLKWLRRPAVVNVLIRQVYFTGVQNVPWILLIALAVGVLAVYNIVLFARSIQDLSLIGTMMRGVLVQELAPFMVAIFLLARSGVAVVTEIGNMHIRGEDAFLRSVGISIYEYLYIPRVLAFALCGMVLTFLFVIVAVGVGGLVVTWGQAINFMEYLVEVRRGVGFLAIAAMTLKGMCYPLLACMVLLDQGCRVGRDPNQIPVRATNGVLGALMVMVMIDVVWVVTGSMM